MAADDLVPYVAMKSKAMILATYVLQTNRPCRWSNTRDTYVWMQSYPVTVSTYKNHVCLVVIIHNRRSQHSVLMPTGVFWMLQFYLSASHSRHYSDVIMGVTSPALPLLTQPLIWAQIKEHVKAPRRWPLWGQFTGNRWKCFYLMTSSWHFVWESMSRQRRIHFRQASMFYTRCLYRVHWVYSIQVPFVNPFKFSGIWNIIN